MQVVLAAFKGKCFSSINFHVNNAISDLVIADVFMHSLPGMTLLYLATHLFYTEIFSYDAYTLMHTSMHAYIHIYIHTEE